jgi:uncharacterized phosphosugar-binding protein
MTAGAGDAAGGEWTPRSGGDFGELMRAHLELVEARNREVLDRVADRALEVIAAGGVLLTAGTGHSMALVLESFYRAGGLACVKPVYHPGLLPLSGGLASSLIERGTGLAALLVAAAEPRPGELAFVFSSSGANPVPVELARCLRDAGVEVVAVTSLPHLRQAPARAGVKLDEVADLVIDTMVPPGDAAYPRGRAVTGPLSSLTSVYLWNLLLARLLDRAATASVELPLWRSSNSPGGDGYNAELGRRYRTRVPSL